MAGADWSLPTVATNDLDYVDDANARDVDAATMFIDTPTNQPTGSIRWNRSSLKFQEWSGAAWVDLVLSIAGGGTSGATAAAARTALGLGSMATQNNSAVNITGGTISGVTMDASVITTGTLGLNRGGTGASLALGALGTVLGNVAGSVAFGFISNANIDVAAAIAWPKISKAGSSLADLDTRSASDLSSGTLPDARFPATLPAISGVNLTSLNGSNIASGTVAPARLGSGSPSSSNFLRGDGSWQVVPSEPFGTYDYTKTVDTTYTAATGLLVFISVDGSGAATGRTGSLTAPITGAGLPHGSSTSFAVVKGANWIVDLDGGSAINVTIVTLTVGS